MNPYADVSPSLRHGGDRPIDASRYVVFGRAFGHPYTTMVEAPDERTACNLAAAKARRQGFAFRADHARVEAFPPAEFEATYGIAVQAPARARAVRNTCPDCGVSILPESRHCRDHAPRIGFVKPGTRAWHERKSEYIPVAALAEPGER